ncbi:trypsin-like serine protease [Shimia sp. R9_3]|uniref:trypsin-like serine peptidase n=1 Tax=Shimia sp. R9_3 TaxID=2821113 RepID=UPI001ADB6ED3|nr:trypsin-like serine protease [Shimia sp. R9_3]MBO9399318.1 trypsin-like serine protease [Shimia sp. R9_3]
MMKPFSRSCAFLIALLCALSFAQAQTTTAPDAGQPDAGPLGDDLYVLQLDALCGAGKQLSQGCQAIRDRQILDASVAPWRAIGRVNFASTSQRQHCTGALVSEQIVLTASHCLYNFARKTWIPPQSIRFVAGYQRSTAVAVSQVARYVLHEVQDPHSRNFKGDFPRDWALLILKDPIGRETGFLETVDVGSVSAQNADFALAGYPALRPHVLSLAQDCGAPGFSTDRRLMFQRCATMHGDSGAPALALIEGVPKVVGIVTGAVSKQSEFLSVAIPLKSFAAALELERNWEGQ